MGPDVTPEYVCLSVVEIPGGYQDDVVLTYPHSSLELAPDSALASLTVGTLYDDLVASPHLNHSTEKFALLRHDELLQICFV